MITPQGRRLLTNAMARHRCPQLRPVLYVRDEGGLPRRLPFPILSAQWTQPDQLTVTPRFSVTEEVSIIGLELYNRAGVLVWWQHPHGIHCLMPGDVFDLTVNLTVGPALKPSPDPGKESL